MRRFATTIASLLLLLSAGTAAFGQAHLNATMTGDQERPAVVTAAHGSAVFALIGDELHFYLTAEGLTGPITAAHIHSGKRGVNGGVIHNIFDDFKGGNTAHGTWSGLTAAQITDLIAGNYYVNVHTAANPGGEIRGQIDIAGGTHFTANLNAAQENPGTGAAGLGTGSFTLTPEGLEYKITVNALTGGISAAHFHTGDIGVNGGVAFDIGGSFSGTTAEGVWRRGAGAGALTDALVKELLLGRLYVNVHTAANPGGEIRGQVLLASGFGGSARLDQAQEVPPTGAAGQGTAAFTLTPDGLVFNITVEGLTGPITAAHFHRAAAGSNGGVVRTLTGDFSGGTASGVWRSSDSEPLTDDLICALFSQDLYVNVHTAAHPGGEIRGQVLLYTGNTTLVANLSSNQEEPTNPSTGRGTATLRLSGTTLSYDVSVQGLTGAITAAHFHLAPIGTNGGVIFNIAGAFVGNTAHGSLAGLTAAQVKDFLKGNFYVNVHTAANPGGEIRGQAVLSSGCGLRFPFSDDQEVPATGSTALGTGSATLTNDGLVYAITVSGLGSAFSAAHFHGAATGVNGGVVRDFTGSVASNHVEDVWSPADAQPLSATMRDNLMLGNIYANVHTVGNPGGEIRGQLNPATGFAAEGPLVGGAEVPPVPTFGMGAAGTTLCEGGIVYGLSFADLTSAFTAAHFHSAPPGSNGGVVFNITSSVVGGTGRGVWTRTAGLTDALICDYFAGELYINVHTTVNPGGEIRSNLFDLTPSDAPEPSILSAQLQLRTAPNPTRGLAAISYRLPESSFVALRIYDAQGALVHTLANETQEAGSHEVEIDGSGWSGGIYFVRLETGLGSATRKLILVP
ncbi:MAG: CHRD domain-containing protein [Candidatus Eisenbacteria bacterium]|uniref:CHRD domain-containing protein n=1 Tax=Eiseniibacteriota bacterium TaxID=2212470 RepID=A0A956LX81_UNCEI|nr:CHRD domain-containing protein [Candidatus Eisenbacteria bacterium]